MGSIDSRTIARGGSVPMPLAGSILAGTKARVVAGVAVILVVSAAIVATRVTAAPPAAPLRTAAVARGTVTEAVQVSGSVTPAAQVRLNFKSSGRLAQVMVKVGDVVAAGAPLAQLDVTDLQIALRQAQANLVQAQASYDRATAGASAEDVAIAKNAVDNAQRNLQQTQQSTQNDLAAAQQSLTKVQTSYASAKANFATLTAAIPSDTNTYAQGITPIGLEVLGVRGTLDSTLRPGDVTTARNALVSAEVTLGGANNTATQTLAPALTDYVNAAGMVQASVNVFDLQVGQGRDTTSAVSQFQSAQTAFQTASARLSSAVDAVAAQLSSAQTSVNTAQSSLTTEASRADPTLDQPRLDVARTLVDLTNEQQLVTAIKNRITQASSSLQGVSDPIAGGIVSAQQGIQSAQTKADQSLSSQSQAITSAQLNLQKTAAGPRSYDIAQALAGVTLAQIAIDKAQNDLNNATLTAPAAGTVASIANQPGETIGTAAANGFILLALTSSLTLHGTVGEADVAKLKLGQAAVVSVDALGAATRLTGRVTSLDPVATIQQGVPVYGVDVTIDVADAGVRSGMTGTANVIIASKQSVLTVPNLAIRSQSGRRFVQVMRNGKPEDADVTFGISNDSVTEVTSGLEEGDQVVLPAPRAAASSQPNTNGGGFGGGGVQIRR